MNKTFKVVFNKARNALTAVNEATASVQRKGTKTVLATAVVTTLAAGSAFAAASSPVMFTENGAVASEVKGISVEQNQDGSYVVTANGYQTSGYGVVSNNNNGSVYNVNIGQGSEFKNNQTTGSASAVVIFQNGKHGTTVTQNTITGTTFESNSSARKGGAVASMLESSKANGELYGTTTVESSTFKGNSADQGGAIYGEYTGFVINDSDFIQNYANKKEGESDGGAITAEVSNLQITGSTFDGNTAADNGGAIMSWSDSDGGNREQVFSVIGSTFNKNTAEDKGGAIAWLQKESTEKGEQFLNVQDSDFTGNVANEIGGAIAAESDVKVTAESSFSENFAEQYGGAIYAKRSLEVDNSHFTANKTNGSGGAIYVDNYGIRQEGAYPGWQPEDELKRSITNSTFTGNTAEKKGGAIAILTESDYYAVPTEIDHNEFVSNSAGTTGGAIQAEDDVAITNSNFLNNTAAIGGAVNVDLGAAVTAEDVTFTGNTAETAGGAINITEGSIVNLKNASFANNKVGDQFNDINNAGTINASGEITLDGGISGAGKLKLAEGTHLTVIAGHTTITNAVENSGATLSLTFDRGFTGEYQLITDGGSLDNDFALADNGIYNITKGDANGTYVVEKLSTEEVAAKVGADSNQANGLTAITEGAQDGGNQMFDTIADFVNTNIQSSNADDRQAALDAVSALSVETAPMIVQTETDNVTQVYKAIGSRLGMTSAQKPSSNLWVQGIFSTGEYDDNGSAKGYDTDSNGLAFGLDSALTDSFRLGVGFAYTDTEIDGFLRDTDVESKTAFIYGQYKPSNWYVNGILSYAWSSYEESKHVAGLNVGADYDVETFGVQAMTGYDFEVAGMNLTPEGGLRYLHLSQDSYTDASGTNVDGEDNDVLTAVIGAKINKAWEVSPAVVIKPQARVAMTYDIVDADNDAVLTLANGASYRVEGETMDRFGVEVDVGVSAEVSDSFEFGLSYFGNFRGDFQNHAGFLNAKYKF